MAAPTERRHHRPRSAPKRQRCIWVVGLLAMLVVMNLLMSAFRVGSGHAGHQISFSESSAEAAGLADAQHASMAPESITRDPGAGVSPQQHQHQQVAGHVHQPSGEVGAPILARLHAMAAAAAAAAASANASSIARIARVGVNNQSDPYLSPARVRQLRRQFHGRQQQSPPREAGG